MNRLEYDSRATVGKAWAVRMLKDHAIRSLRFSHSTHANEPEPGAHLVAPRIDWDSIRKRRSTQRADFQPLSKPPNPTRRVEQARYDHNPVGLDARPERWQRPTATRCGARLLATFHHQSTLPGLLPPRLRSSWQKKLRWSICSRPDRRSAHEIAHPGLAAQVTPPIDTPEGFQISPPSVLAEQNRLQTSGSNLELLVRIRRPLRSPTEISGYGDGRWWGPTRPGNISGIRDRAAATLTDEFLSNKSHAFNQTTRAMCPGAHETLPQRVSKVMTRSDVAGISPTLELGMHDDQSIGKIAGSESVATASVRDQNFLVGD